MIVHAQYSPNLLGEGFGSVHRGDLGPFGLIDANAIEDRRELVTILGLVDLSGVCPENVDARVLEAERNVLRKLT